MTSPVPHVQPNAEPTASDCRLRVLAISFLFPNSVYPNRGIFVLNRLKAVQAYADVKVINPILWFPFCSRLARYEGYDRIPARETIDGIEVFHPRFFSIPVVFKFVIAVTYAIATALVALRVRRNWRFDVIDLHWTYPDLPAGRLLARLLGLRQLVTIRGVPALKLGRWTLQQFITDTCLRRSDHVITLSDELRAMSIERGVAAERATTVRNGVDVDRFFYQPRVECRRELGLSEDATIIFGAGYLTPRKGFDRIIRALPELLTLHKSIELYLAGPAGTFAQGDRTDELRELAQSLGVADRLHLIGEVQSTSLRDWYGAADVFCLSSRSEGCPNVLMEALACGCPVVATDVGAVSEVVCTPWMGEVVASSRSGIAVGLKRALARQFDRQKIASSMSALDWDWCARQVLDLYGQPQQAPNLAETVPV